MPRMTLYNWWRSSCSHRVRIALAMKGLDYEYAVVRLPAGEQSREEHRARSPTAYVPCLVIDGVPYVESVSIIELLEERFPAPPLFPIDPHGRARVRTLVEIVNSGIQPFQNTSVTAHVAAMMRAADPAGPPGRAPATPPSDAASVGWIRHFVDRGLGAFERAMEANAREGVLGPYAYGAVPTVADVFLVPQVVVARRVGVAVEHHARVCAAFEAAARVEAFQKAAPENQIDADVADGAKGAR
jgi:maleylacetoacetate isomerase